jgi:hypothetical protein
MWQQLHEGLGTDLGSELGGSGFDLEVMSLLGIGGESGLLWS